MILPPLAGDEDLWGAVDGPVLRGVKAPGDVVVREPDNRRDRERVRRAVWFVDATLDVVELVQPEGGQVERVAWLSTECGLVRLVDHDLGRVVGSRPRARQHADLGVANREVVCESVDALKAACDGQPERDVGPGIGPRDAG